MHMTTPRPLSIFVRYRKSISLTGQLYSATTDATTPAIAKLIAKTPPHPIALAEAPTLLFFSGKRQSVEEPFFPAQSTNFWAAATGVEDVGTIAMQPTSRFPTFVRRDPENQSCQCRSRTEEIAGIPVGMADADADADEGKAEDTGAVLVADADEDDGGESELDENMVV
ncbi:hypothetical protein B0H19DRAFT_1259336 [Mycena capillaripes]|nr:hypothetical protein B0H19DRAFT_1259336 [Mycena capillaripes]